MCVYEQPKERRVGPCSSKVALQRRLQSDDQWVNPHNPCLAMFANSAALSSQRKRSGSYFHGSPKAGWGNDANANKHAPLVFLPRAKVLCTVFPLTRDLAQTTLDNTQGSTHQNQRSLCLSLSVSLSRSLLLPAPFQSSTPISIEVVLSRSRERFGA